MRRLQRWFIGWLCLGLAVCLPAVAQTKLDNGQLDQLMAPVALADRILVIDDGAVVFDERVELARPRARGSPAFAALAARVLRAVLKEPEPPDADRPLAPVIQIRHLRLAV